MASSMQLRVMIAKGTPIWLLMIAKVAAISATGQNYAERGYNQAGLELQYYEPEYVTEEGDWNEEEPEVWRWNVENFPHPQLEPAMCRRSAPSNICNPNEVLTVKEARSLDYIINSIYNETSCICERCDPHKEGVQIGVAILKYTYKPYNEMPSKIVQSFTKNLRSKWRLGDCDDDILIVLVTEDRLSYTDVGRATSTYISEERAYQIFLESKANFTQRRYYDGLKNMLEAYREAAKKIPRKVEKKDLNMGRITGIIFGTLFVVFILAIVGIWFYKKYKKINNYKGNGGSADVPSSTWRRTLHLSAAGLKSPKEHYKPCKTEEEFPSAINDTVVTDVPEEATNQDTTLRDESEQKTSTVVPVDQSNESSPHEDEQETAALRSSPHEDVQETAVLTTFQPLSLPLSQRRLHQTDL